MIFEAALSLHYLSDNCQTFAKSRPQGRGEWKGRGRQKMLLHLLSDKRRDVQFVFGLLDWNRIG